MAKTDEEYLAQAPVESAAEPQETSIEIPTDTPTAASPSQQGDTPPSEGPPEPEETDNWQVRASHWRSEADRFKNEAAKVMRELEDMKEFMSLTVQQAKNQGMGKAPEQPQEFDPYDPQQLQQFIAQTVNNAVTNTVQTTLAQQRQQQQLEQWREDFKRRVPGATDRDFEETLQRAQKEITPYHLYLALHHGDKMAEAMKSAQEEAHKRMQAQAEAVQKTPPSVAGAGGEKRPKRQTPEEKAIEDHLGLIEQLDAQERKSATLGIPIVEK